MKITVWSLTWDTDSGFGTDVYATKAERDAELIACIRSYDVDVPNSFDPDKDELPSDFADGDGSYTWDSHTIEIPAN